LVKVENVSKSFSVEGGEIIGAIKDISFEIPEGAFFVLLGPSGCGKTTTLRSIAGLERPESGKICIGNRLVYSSSDNIFVPPNQRNIGMVFQSYAIWPHMDVFHNAAFPLEIKKCKKSEIHTKVTKALELVHLTDLERRSATKLSGGQQQRLALARALVEEPSLMLFDEPLSNLDAKLREEMRFELKQLQKRLGITAIYVTHDQIEALSLGDFIAVLKDGVIQQIGTPQEIYQGPANSFVAGFVGFTNWISAKVVALHDGTSATLETSDGLLNSRIVGKCGPGDTVNISMRPEFITVHTVVPEDRKSECWRGHVEVLTFLGEYWDCQVRVGDHRFKVGIPTSVPVQLGKEVYLEICMDRIVGYAR
jgi:iron(III) transport system ATP-binding protein